MVWIIVLMLFLCSIVCMFSSTSRLLKDDMSRVDLLSEQLITVLLGLALVVIIYNIRNIKAFRIASSLGLLVSFVFLFLLDIRINTPFIRAIETNNAYRILSVNGFQIHVFEIVKVAMVMYLAWAVDAIRNGCRLMPGNNLSQKWKSQKQKMIL